MKVILVGGPRSGKSTYARSLRSVGIPTYCTDPKYLVKDPEAAVMYLPHISMDWSSQSQFVADEWMKMSGPWCIEGVATVRALRKYLEAGGSMEGIQVVKFNGQYPDAVTTKGQTTMMKGIDIIWNEIKVKIPHFTVRNVHESACKK